jgi:hypothetical protein
MGAARESNARTGLLVCLLGDLYAAELEACGLKITESRSLGVRSWYGCGPWVATRLVAAVNP